MKTPLGTYSITIPSIGETCVDPIWKLSVGVGAGVLVIIIRVGVAVESIIVGFEMGVVTTGILFV